MEVKTLLKKFGLYPCFLCVLTIIFFLFSASTCDSKTRKRTKTKVNTTSYSKDLYYDEEAEEKNAEDLFVESLKNVKLLRRGLAYSLQLFRDSEPLTKVSNNFSFRSGDKVRFQLKSNCSGYAYLIMAEGSTRQRKVLYPEAGQVCKLTRNAQVTIPTKGFLHFDKNAGTEIIEIVLSEQPLDQAILLKKQTGVFVLAQQFTTLKQKDYSASRRFTNNLFTDSTQPKDGMTYIVKTPPKGPIIAQLALKHEGVSTRNSTDLSSKSLSQRDVSIDPTSKDSSSTVASIPAHRRNFALVIGTDDYRDNGFKHLNNAVADIDAIGAELEQSYGFTVQYLRNSSKREMETKILQACMAEYNPADQLFIYIAGHGLYDPGQKDGFIVATDSERADILRDSYLSYSRLRNWINNSHCDHVLVSLDVCFGATFLEQVAEHGGLRSSQDVYEKMSLEDILKRSTARRTRRLVSSGAVEPVYDGAAGVHSPFARSFLSTLRTYGGSKGYLRFSDIESGFGDTKPGPVVADFGKASPGSDFLFVTKLK